MRRPFTLLLVPLRLVAVAVVTAVLYPVMLAGRLVVLGDRRRRLAWCHRMARTWFRALAPVLGMRVVLHGRPPEPPFLLVSNHQSYVDVLLLGGAAGGVFVARADLAGWPVLGHLARSVGTVFLDRASKRDLTRATVLIERALADGLGVVLFPEGTTGAGPHLLPFKPALLEVAAAHDLRVHHAVLRYSHPAVPWADDTPFPAHVANLLRLPTFTAHVTFGATPLHDRDRKRLTERLRAAMEKQLIA